MIYLLYGSDYANKDVSDTDSQAYACIKLASPTAQNKYLTLIDGHERRNASLMSINHLHDQRVHCLQISNIFSELLK